MIELELDLLNLITRTKFCYEYRRLHIFVSFISFLYHSIKVKYFQINDRAFKVNSRINSVLLLQQHRTIMLGPPYSACTNDAKLRWFSTYTKKVCHSTNLINHFICTLTIERSFFCNSLSKFLL